MHRLISIALVLVLLAAASCDDAGSAETTVVETTVSEELVADEPEGGEASSMEEMVARAVADLARRLSLDEDEISLLEARNVTWPDTSLGCPEPGTMYAQVLQPGVLIRLSAADQMYFYHGVADGEPFLCEQASQVIPEADPKTDEFVPPPDSDID